MQRTSLAVVLPLICLLALGGLVGCSGGADSAQPVPSSPSAVALRPPPSEERAARVLRQWDERRASAYASGSVRELRKLYVDGSPAGAADARLLRAYVDRGLVVSGLRMQVLALDVRRHDRELLRLRVTDRVVGAEALGPAGVLPLPRDSPTTRVLALRSVQGEWRVAAVSAARQPAAPRQSGARK